MAKGRNTLSDKRPYKVYTALLTQSGTDAPVATVLENTLGGTVSFSYSGVGSYIATLSGAFTVNKCYGTISNKYDSGAGNYAYIERLSVDDFRINTVDNSVNPANDVLIGNEIEIRVYK